MNKIYLLRHEKRPDNKLSFSTNLTNEGMDNSQTIVLTKIKDINPKYIYSSPFVRTLETIYPYCKEKNLKVNLEWSLAESMPQYFNVPERFNDIINHDYKSVLQYNNRDILSLNPIDQDDKSFYYMKMRIRIFVDSLKHDDTVLLVTHMPIINAYLSEIRDCKYIQKYSYHKCGSLIDPDNY